MLCTHPVTPPISLGNAITALILHFDKAPELQIAHRQLVKCGRPPIVKCQCEPAVAMVGPGMAKSFCSLLRMQHIYSYTQNEIGNNVLRTLTIAL